MSSKGLLDTFQWSFQSLVQASEQRFKGLWKTSYRSSSGLFKTSERPFNSVFNTCRALYSLEKSFKKVVERRVKGPLNAFKRSFECASKTGYWSSKWLIKACKKAFKVSGLYKAF